MSIDKSIRQYYSRGQLVQPGPGRPGYQGPAGGSHGSYGGSSSPSRGGGGGGGGGRDRHPPAPAPKPAPTPTRAPDFITGGDLHKDPVAIDQGFVDTKPKPETYTPPVRHHADTKETLEEQRQLDIQQMIARQQEEKYGPLADPTKFGETVKGPDLRTEKEKGEDWERSQDWDKVKKLSDKGYDFKEIQDAMEKGLLTKADPQSMRTNLLGRGLRSLRNIMPETNLEKRLLGGLKKSFADTGKNYLENYAKKAATNFALKKLGLGAFIPWLGIASLFFPGKKDAFVSKFPKRKGTAIEPVAWQGGDDRVSEDIVTTSVKKFKPTKSQEDQIAEINRKRLILLEHARTGRLNETGQNTLAQFDKLLKQYKTSPETLWT